MVVPGLHVVTDDEVLADDRFRERARRLLDAHGPAVALHLRGPRTATPRLLDLARSLAPVARGTGARLLVNDRADVALAVGADGIQLGRRSLPIPAARSLCPEWLVGASVHDVEGAMAAREADFLVLGTIWRTPSHPERAGAGLDLVREVAGRVSLPIIAIGGVTSDRAAMAREAGAGVAVIRGVWEHDDPVVAAASYLETMSENVGGRT